MIFFSRLLRQIMFKMYPMQEWLGKSAYEKAVINVNKIVKKTGSEGHEKVIKLYKHMEKAFIQEKLLSLE